MYTHKWKCFYYFALYCDICSKRLYNKHSSLNITTADKSVYVVVKCTCTIENIAGVMARAMDNTSTISVQIDSE